MDDALVVEDRPLGAPLDWLRCSFIAGFLVERELLLLLGRLLAVGRCTRCAACGPAFAGSPVVVAWVCDPAVTHD